MQRASLLALLVATILPAVAIAGDGSVKPQVRKPAVTEFARLARHKVPKVTSVDVVFKLKPDEPNMAPPTLTAEQLAVDKVTFDIEHIAAPQVGLMLWAVFLNNWTPAFRRAWYLGPGRGSSITFHPLATWAHQRDLRVTCAGDQIEAMKVSYGRWSYAKFKSEELGSMTLDQDGDNSLKFLLPASSLADWEYAFIRIEDADGLGNDVYIDSCILERI